jgi:predicted DNA-binding antitoxin AbrB/MazE fold protein
MERKVQAVYADGVLRLAEPLHLEEMQKVTVTIAELHAVDDDLAGYFPVEKWPRPNRTTLLGMMPGRPCPRSPGPYPTSWSPNAKSANCQTVSSTRAPSQVVPQGARL